MTVYDRQIASAKRMLRKYGQFITLTSITTGDYDPDTGTASTTEAGETVSGAIFDYQAKHIDGTLIRQGDKQVFIAASGMTTTPAPGMKLTDTNGDVFTVLTAQALAPDGTAIIHTLQVRA